MQKMASYLNERNFFTLFENPMYIKSPSEAPPQDNTQTNPAERNSQINREPCSSTYVPSTTEGSEQSEGSSRLVETFTSMSLEDRPLPHRPPHDRLVLTETGEELYVEAELREGQGEVEPDDDEEEVYESMTVTERERAQDLHNFRMRAQYHASQLSPGLMDTLTKAELRDLISDAMDSLERRYPGE